MPKTIGIIGLGSIGSRHARNLVAMGHNVYSYDLKSTEGRGVRKSVDDLIKVSDAVIIASPTTTHAAYIDETWKVGKPVFCEKPLSDKLTTSVAYPIMVGYNLRFHSCIKQAKEWIDAGMIGEPLWGNFCVGQLNIKYSDSVVLNWSHEIDLALYLLGPAEIGASMVAKVDDRDVLADIILVHKAGCQSTVHLDYLTQPEIRQSIIVGSGATIIMDLVNRQAWLRGADGTLWDHLEGQDSWDENYVEEMEAFIDRLDGKETLGCTGTEGLEALKICLDAKKLLQ